MNAYDFDKTIYKNDSSADFFLFCLKRHPKILLLTPKIILSFAKFYIFNKGTKTQFKEKVFSFVKYIDKERDIDDFWKKHKGRIKDFYIRQQQNDDVIISASPVFLLEPVCSALGIKHLIASEVDVETGKFLKENCHGKEKVKRFREVFGDATVDSFYSDSYSDTPMAEIAQQAFIVKNEKITNWEF
ncbi:MAG: HAD-IB family phosphatase [Clostridia bacterium]|nr:HAD-IB family phosphatase [Clostridia bacterium]